MSNGFNALFCCFRHTHCVWCEVYNYVSNCCTVLGLQNDLKRQEEQIHEMEENISILRKELNKTEQARKDSSIKVPSTLLQTSQFILSIKQNTHNLALNILHLLYKRQIGCFSVCFLLLHLFCRLPLWSCRSPS